MVFSTQRHAPNLFKGVLSMRTLKPESMRIAIMNPEIALDGNQRQGTGPTFNTQRITAGSSVWRKDIYGNNVLVSFSRIASQPVFCKSSCAIECVITVTDQDLVLTRIYDLSSNITSMFRIAPGAAPNERMICVKADSYEWAILALKMFLESEIQSTGKTTAH